MFLHSHALAFYYSFATQLKPLQNGADPKSLTFLKEGVIRLVCRFGCIPL